MTEQRANALEPLLIPTLRLLIALPLITISFTLLADFFLPTVINNIAPPAVARPSGWPFVVAELIALGFLVVPGLPNKLGPHDFEYDFVEQLKESFAQRGLHMSRTGQQEFERSIASAKKQFMPFTFENIGVDHHALPISLAVVSSASFPPIVGPVTYRSDGRAERYIHVGDGGLFDNLGTESLTTLFLSRIPKDPQTNRRGLIIVVDSSFPFSAGEEGLNHNTKGFQVFRKDPARIVGIMEARANAYQTMLWQSLRSQDVLLPDYDHLKIVILRHIDAKWEGGYADLPEICRGRFPTSVTPEQIQSAVSQIPTQFKIEDECDGALLIHAGRQVVEQQHELLDRFFSGTTPPGDSGT